ncbi:MAG: glycosyltransferase family A protein [Acutalibacteraceae bacterium]|nr:glycosyltransferase family A protein [Acutalibacteraceae bacterium]
MVDITVFTPAYNRANLLPRLYESLKRQTSKNFKWILVDDGSTDNTRELAEKWVKETTEFEIKYIHKENGGLHTAYNSAIAELDTELSVCIDSDDYMPDYAIKLITEFWKENGSDKYAGIVAPDSFENGEIIGDPLPDQKTVNLIDLLTGKYNIVNGDRKNVVRSDLYKSVAPMMSYEGEKNFNPHYMHLQISEKYDFLVLNKSLCVVEYQSDGMTNNMIRQYYTSPNSFAQTRRLYLSFKDTSFKFKMRNSIHYVSSCLLSKQKNIIKNSPKKGYAIVAFPFGFMLSKYIKYKYKKNYLK